MAERGSSHFVSLNCVFQSIISLVDGMQPTKRVLRPQPATDHKTESSLRKQGAHSGGGVIVFPLMTAQLLTCPPLALTWLCVRVSLCSVCLCSCMCTLLCIVCGGGRGGVKHTVVSRKRLFCSCRCVWEDAVEWGHLGLWILGELRNYLLCFRFKCKCWECELLQVCIDTMRGE